MKKSFTKKSENNNVFMHNREETQALHHLKLCNIYKKQDKNLLKKIVLNKLTKHAEHDKFSLTLNLKRKNKKKGRNV